MGASSCTAEQSSGQYPIVSKVQRSNTFHRSLPRINSEGTEKQFLETIYPGLDNIETPDQVDLLIERLERKGFAALITRCFKYRINSFNVSDMRAIIANEGFKTETPKLMAALDFLQRDGQLNVTLSRLYQLINERSPNIIY